MNNPTKHVVNNPTKTTKGIPRIPRIPGAAGAGVAGKMELKRARGGRGEGGRVARWERLLMVRGCMYTVHTKVLENEKDQWVPW